MPKQRFTAAIETSGARTYLKIPFDPDEAWGAKDRHYVTGSIDGHPFRGCLETDAASRLLPIGPAWMRDNEVSEGMNVEVILAPDGPQIETLSTDMAAALNGDPEAKRFFESLPPFYRNNHVRAIESAKRPETRARRIAEMLETLRAGQKQR
jgi:hypothetical protein